MIQILVASAVGLVTFILVLGVGNIVTDRVAASQCTGGGYSYWNTTDQVCQNGTGIGTNYGTPASNTTTGTTIDTIVTLRTYLGTGNGSLGGWTGAVIALIIGVAFIGAIMSLTGKNQ